MTEMSRRRRQSNEPSARPIGPRRASLVEMLERDPERARELGAARLASSVQSALEQALAAAGVSQTELADALGVTPSAVSQVLDSQGNLRISTIGRYARQLGYQAAVCLFPVVPGLPPLNFRLPANIRKRQPVVYNVTELGLGSESTEMNVKGLTAAIPRSAFASSEKLVLTSRALSGAQ